MNRINRMTVRQMSELSGLPVEVIQRRVAQKKPRAYGDGGAKEYKVLFDYLMPHYGKNGLVTASYLGSKMMVPRDTIRKRLLKQLKTPDYVLDDGRNTYLWKNNEQTQQAALIKDDRPKVRDVKKAERVAKQIAQQQTALTDDDGPVVYKGDALKLVTDERKKKQWVGRQGVLFDGRNVLAEGTIEHVTSIGVLVNGVVGQLWMLGLKDGNPED